MTDKKFALLTTVLLAVVLSTLSLTLIKLTSVQAETTDENITIVKEADQMVVSGSTANFYITVTNVGTATLINVTVSDPLAPNCNRSIGSLGVGASYGYACSLADVESDLTNHATVTGIQSGTGGLPASDSDTAFVDVINPAIEIAKTPDTQMVTSGSTAMFTITITNTGDVDLSDVSVADPLAPNCEFGPLDLEIGQSSQHNCNSGSVTDGFINIATATGTSPADDTVSNADAAQVILNETLTCPADMIAYWRLDETSGTTYDDFYGGHDGVCDSLCPSPTAGQVNGGQAFDDSDAGIAVPPVPGGAAFDWSASDSFSIEFWMHTDSVTACSTENEVMVGRVDTVDSSNRLAWWVGCWAGGEAAFFLRDTSGAGTSVRGNTDLTDGSWHHIVAVKERIASTDRVRIYVDGTEQDASEPQSYAAGFDSPTADLTIGWLNQLSSHFQFDGDLDEVALYSEALSPTEIEQHYYEGLMAERWYCEDSAFAPTIYSTPVTEISAQRPYAYDVNAIGNPVPTYTLTISPAGMTIDPASGLISWKPVVTQQGSHPVQVEARNSEGTDTQDFSVEVAEGPLCPVDMISYWKLDEISGTTYADFYNGNDGTCNAGQCPSPITGRVNGGQAFDEDNTEINVPADVSFDWGVDDSFSIEFWMQTNETSTCSENQVIVGRDDSSTDLHWWVGCWDGGQATFYLIDKGGATTWVTGTTYLTDGAWHHVVAVREKGSSTDEIRLYVDGSEENSGIASFSDGFDSPTSALNIGWLNLSTGFHFTGTIDEVALYDRALDITEIQQHHERGLAGAGFCYSPEITIEKSAYPTIIYAGNTVTYTYTVTNPGDDPLSNVTVSDDRCSPVAQVVGDDELDPDETWTYRCSTTLDEDTTNLATAEGIHSLGGTISDTASAFVNVIKPQIAIAKTAYPTVIQIGEAVTYTYTVTNPGDDPLSNVAVSDDRCGPVVLMTGDGNLNNALDLVETWIYTCSTTLLADTTNTAVVTGTDSLGHTVSDMDVAFVNVVNPWIAIAKSANPTMIHAGDTVTYSYTVTTPSTGPLSNVNVSDDRCSPVAFMSGDVNGNNQLDPSESWIYRCSTALDNDTTNIATAHGVHLLGGTVSDTATAFVDVIHPEIGIAKAASEPTVHAGDTVTYTYTVNNPGDVPLSDVTVSDNHCRPLNFVSGDTNLDDDLDTTETWTYTCSMVLLVDIVNVALATGIDSLGYAVSDTAAASVSVIGGEGLYKIYLPLVLNRG